MLSQMPVVFEANRGQWNTPATLVARGRGLLVGFESSSIMLGLEAKNEKGESGSVGVRMAFAGAAASPPRGEHPLPGVRNYLRGDDPAAWHTNVALFESVRYDDVYPGVSVVIGNRDGRLEYDLELASSTSIEAVRVDCDGVDGIDVSETGSLEMHTAYGTLSQSRPKSWYVTADGSQRPADCRFRRLGETSYGFELVNPEEGRVVVDPGLDWSTFLGGSDADSVNGIDVQNGLVTVVGATKSVNFPIQTGFQSAIGGGQDAFATRFDPSLIGSFQLVWSTYLGGSGDDGANGVVVDSNGVVSLCGATKSTDFPIVAGAPQGTAPGPAGQQNAFVSRLSSNGASLLYSTYFGGSTGPSTPFLTHANAITIDANGVMTVVGRTDATNIPLVNAYDTTYSVAVGQSGDPWVAQFDPSISGTGSLTYSTYVGGLATGYDEAFAVDVSSGLIYLGGSTTSADYGTTGTGAFQQLAQGSLDGFIAVLKPTDPPAIQLKYSTYLGSTGNDRLLGLVVNNLGVIYCCGSTSANGSGGAGGAGAAGFPTSTITGGFYAGCEADAYQTVGGPTDAWVVKLDRNAIQQLRYGSLLGGDNLEVAYAIARVSATSVIVVGTTNPGNLLLFPTTVGAHDTTTIGPDSFLTRLDWTGAAAPAVQLSYSTFLGGDVNADTATSLVIDGSRAYVGGFTSSTDFPTVNPYDSSYNGGLSTGDGFACRFVLPASQ